MNQIGLQLYSIRDVFLKDEASIRDGFRAIADMGYTQAEPAGFLIDPALFARYAKDAGVQIVNTHYSAQTVLDNPEEAVRVHDLFGCHYIGTGGYGMSTPDEVSAFIDGINKSGKVLKKAGYKFVYHNHSHEFIKMANGKSTYEMLLEGLDPECAALELDCFWAQNAGVDPASFIQEHKDLIRLIHVKDMGVRRNPETNRAENFITEVGHGNMNYKKIVKAADEAGVEFFVVEQDTNWIDGDPLKAVASSCDYIRKNLFNL